MFFAPNQKQYLWGAFPLELFYTLKVYYINGIKNLSSLIKHFMNLNHWRIFNKLREEGHMTQRVTANFIEF